MGFSYKDTQNNSTENYNTQSKPIKNQLFNKKPSIKELYSFFIEFSTYYQSGYPLIKALDLLAEQAVNPKMKKAISQMSLSIQDSNSLAKAFADQDVFPKYCSNIIKAGENTGILDKLLEEIGEHLRQDDTVRDSIKSSLLIPKIVASFLVIALIVIFAKVIPQYQEAYKSFNANLPLLTKIVFNLYDFCKNNFILLLIVLVISVFLILGLIRKNPRFIDSIKLKIPIYSSLYYKILQYRFSKSFGLLLEAGTPAPNALEFAGNVMDNMIAKEILIKAAKKTLDGIPISDAIRECNNQKIIDYMPLNNIITGQETGKTPYLMNKSANHYTRLIEMELKDFATKVGTALLIPMACIELVVLLAILLPSYMMALSIK